MAKRKKPVNIFDLPKEEVMKASSDIISNTTTPENKETPRPENKAVSNKPKVVNKKKPKNKVKTLEDISPLKRKFLYVDEVHHQKAKINAAMKGMKLQDYIAWLIINDK